MESTSLQNSTRWNVTLRKKNKFALVYCEFCEIFQCRYSVECFWMAASVTLKYVKIVMKKFEANNKDTKIYLKFYA